jgi:predicted anti-sigma-YlaC factor YlaD
MNAGDCEGVRDALPEHVRGAAPPPDRPDIERHLAACAACAAEYRIVALLADTGALMPPERLAERILQTAVPARRVRRHAARYAAAATVAAALVGAGILSREAREPAQPGGAAFAEAAGALVAEAVGVGALTWLDHDPLIRPGVGLHDLSIEELEMLLTELES